MRSLILIMIFCLIHSVVARETDKTGPKAIDLQKASDYRKGQNHFRRKSFGKANKAFEKFIVSHQKDKSPYIRTRIFWAIDLVVRTHLRINKDPDAALAFLARMRKGIKLNEAQEDTIDEWVSVAKQWKKMGKLPATIKSKEELYALGEKFYNQGMSKTNFPADDTGNADFYIAATYLVPFVYNYEGSKNIGKALFMLGNIRFRSWVDYEYWTENFYLKEVIRRFPHSNLAQRAYKSLEQSIRAGYTGSSGENIPISQIKMLEVYKKLSGPRKPVRPLVF